MPPSPRRSAGRTHRRNAEQSRGERARLEDLGLGREARHVQRRIGGAVLHHARLRHQDVHEVAAGQQVKEEIEVVLVLE